MYLDGQIASIAWPVGSWEVLPTRCMGFSRLRGHCHIHFLPERLVKVVGFLQSQLLAYVGAMGGDIALVLIQDLANLGEFLF